MNTLIVQFRKVTPVLLIVFVLGCLALLPSAQAVSPPPDGGYPGGNTAEGQKALQSLTTGGYNAAVGYFSLSVNTVGFFNTAIGAGALDLNTASNNTATGAAALLLNTTGTNNTANGVAALVFNSTGNDNTATGAYALQNNTASGNTGVGRSALFANTTGDINTAIGDVTLFSNTTGSNNTAIGFSALTSNTTGGGNTAIGSDALSSNIDHLSNTAVGAEALNSANGDGNTALGFNACGSVMTASDVLCIGSGVLGFDVSNTTWIANVYGVTTQNGTTAPVIVSADGQLGTVASSERFKKDIASMEKASETILSLRPVRFHYKSDAKNTPQFGLIAEEVAKVNPALVLPDKEGKPYSVRYDAVNAMLLNEFLKEHSTVQEMRSTLAKQEAMMTEQRKDFESKLAQQQQQIEVLTTGLQKVSAQLEASKPAPQMVNNP
jgi:Chaperone of endosialidase